MKITVSFVYKAQVSLKHVKNLTYIYIKDKVEVEIIEKTLAELPLAIKVSEIKNHPWGAERNLHWDGEQLWSFKYEWHFMKPLRKIHINEVIAKTDNENVVMTSRHESHSAPFNVFWHKLFHNTDFADVPMLWDDNVTTKEKATYAKWYGDNKSEAIKIVKDIASKFRIVDGCLYEPAKAPQYEVKTDDKQYSGPVKVFVDVWRLSDNQPIKQFNATELNQAQAFADKLAIERGEPPPARTHKEQVITVLMPEVIQKPPTIDIDDKAIKAFQEQLNTYMIKNTPLSLVAAP